MATKLESLLTTVRPMDFGRVCHNRIVQSPRENYFNVWRKHKEKRDLVKMTIDQTGQSYMGCNKLILLIFLLVANNYSFAHLKALLFLFVKILQEFRLSLPSIDYLHRTSIKHSPNNSKDFQPVPYNSDCIFLHSYWPATCNFIGNFISVSYRKVLFNSITSLKFN